MRTATTSRSADWVQIAPLGEHPHSDDSGRTLVQVIDTSAVRAMANSFRPKVLVDQEHFSYNLSKSSEAYGWLLEVQPRADGLDGLIEWTDKGEEAVANSRYRFISPVWLPRDLEKLGGDRVRPLRIDSLGLTNTPNIKAIKPLLNRSRNASGQPLNGRQRPQMIANRATPQKLQWLGACITVPDCIADLKRATGLSFDQLWNSSAPFLNRFSNRAGALGGDALWQEVLDREQEAFDKTWSLWDRTGSDRKDRGSRLYKSTQQPPGEFTDALLKVVQTRGIPFEEAWSLLRETEPLFFARHVWGMTATDGTSISHA